MTLKQFAVLAALSPLAALGAARSGLDSDDLETLLGALVVIGAAGVVVREMQASEDEE